MFVPRRVILSLRGWHHSLRNFLGHARHLEVLGSRHASPAAFPRAFPGGLQPARRANPLKRHKWPYFVGNCGYFTPINGVKIISLRITGFWAQLVSHKTLDDLMMSSPNI